MKKYHPLASTVNCFPKRKPRALQGLWPRPRQTGYTPCPCCHCRRKQLSSSSSWPTCFCVQPSLPLSCAQKEMEPRRWQRRCYSCWTSNGQGFGCQQPMCGNSIGLRSLLLRWQLSSAVWCALTALCRAGFFWLAGFPEQSAHECFAGLSGKEWIGHGTLPLLLGFS